MIRISQRGVGVGFAVRVVPRAKGNAIEGEYEGALKVRVTAPPADDRANEALRRLLAERLDLPVSAVRIVAGGRSRRKRVEVQGVTPERILALASRSGVRAPERE